MTCLRSRPGRFSRGAGYEVFPVPRLRAAHRVSRDTGSAIVAQLSGAARVVTAAWWIPAAPDRRAPQLAVDGHEDDHLPSAVVTRDVADGRRGSSVFEVMTAIRSSRRTEQIA